MPQTDQPDNLLSDLPRGQHTDHLEKAPSAFFENPNDVAAKGALRFDPKQNKQSKIFLGVVGGTVRTGGRMSDGRVTRWVEGGVPIGVATDAFSGASVIYTDAVYENEGGASASSADALSVLP